MNYRLSRRRFAAGGLALGIASLAGPRWAAAVPAMPTGVPSVPLDLAGLMLTPADLGEAGAGIHSYRWSIPEIRTFGEISTAPTRVSYEPPSRYVDRLRAASWQRECRATIAPPGESPSGFPPGMARGVEVDLIAPLPKVAVFSRVVEFGDAAGAAAAFPDAWLAYDRVITGARIGGRSVTEVLAWPFGEESWSVKVVHEDGITGRSLRMLRLAFRLDRLIAFVEIVDEVDTTDTARLRALAGILERRLAGALAGTATGVGLADRVVRLVGDDVAPIGLEGYHSRDGRVVPVFGEAEAAFGERSATFGDAIAAYSRLQVVLGAFLPNATAIDTMVLEFPDAAASTSWVARCRERGINPFAGSGSPAASTIGTRQAVRGTGGLGDEALFVVVDLAAPGLHVYRAVLIVRRANYAFGMTLSAISPFAPLAGLREVANAQVALLDAPMAPSMLPVPAKLVPA